MSECIEHKPCPYGSHEDCHEMVDSIRNAMWRADEAFRDSGGGTRHYVREALISALAEEGLKVVRVLGKSQEGK